LPELQKRADRIDCGEKARDLTALSVANWTLGENQRGGAGFFPTLAAAAELTSGAPGVAGVF